MQTYTVTLKKMIDEFHLETLNLPGNPEELVVSSAEVNRPALLLAGFTDYFDNRRLQICGKVELSYLEQMSDEKRKASVELLFSLKPTAVVISRNMPVSELMLSSAIKHEVPLLRTGDSTSNFMAAAIAFLNVELAPRITRHGVLVEVYGEGILLLGESGVGKSETAIELVKRGHRLIADDAVDLRRVSNKTVVGAAPENIRYFIELRGIGIINVRRIFGMGAVKPTEKVDLVINMEQWDSTKVYSRVGLENETIEILDIEIPSITIPVKPGRNLAIIIEVAAMNNRQKKMGYNAATELMDALGMVDDISGN